MIDIHSHILPKFDDGARSMEESLEMLRESKRQGVNKVVSTSHCYPNHRSSIRHFISKRQEHLDELRRAAAATGEDLPEIYAGCELNISRDFTKDVGLEELCIEGTNYLLLELPYEPWTEGVMEVVYKVTVRDICPVIAHIDRFLYQKRDMFDALLELDVLYQVNAESFLDRRVMKQLEKLFASGRANFIGSDMHNMADRKPCIQQAKKQIIKNLGQDYWDYLEDNNSRLLQNMEINPYGHHELVKKTFFQRIFSK